MTRLPRRVYFLRGDSSMGILRKSSCKNARERLPFFPATLDNGIEWTGESSA